MFYLKRKRRRRKTRKVKMLMPMLMPISRCQSSKMATYGIGEALFKKNCLTKKYKKVLNIKNFEIRS